MTALALSREQARILVLVGHGHGARSTTDLVAASGLSIRAVATVLDSLAGRDLVRASGGGRRRPSACRWSLSLAGLDLVGRLEHGSPP